MLTRRHQDQTHVPVDDRSLDRAVAAPVIDRTGQSHRGPWPPPIADGRYLLVANRAMADQQLSRLVVDSCRRQPAAVHVVVSRLRRPVLIADPTVGPPVRGRGEQEIAVDDESFRVAEARLASFLRALSGLGCALSGEIVAHGPFKGARRVLEAGNFDEVLVLTEAVADRRLRRDTVERLRRSSAVPVTPILVRPVLNLDEQRRG